MTQGNRDHTAGRVFPLHLINSGSIPYGPPCTLKVTPERKARINAPAVTTKQKQNDLMNMWSMKSSRMKFLKAIE